MIATWGTHCAEHVRQALVRNLAGDQLEGLVLRDERAQTARDDVLEPRYRDGYVGALDHCSVKQPYPPGSDTYRH